ncbi:GGDEF domain-containing phosphodiesterase [Rhodococcus sp. UNC23MFCrub1.1]|uniref:GGDEF domain-containing phosphodiesterase n=1 Tax=Rhodococcus sp. UNC23MFCrub1.1 TaxID=1449068 RepID=UPI000484023F|nr:GGDEF domain-containing phosphodiesterase [Rhodococcus sp. UNC23MFCrub1.1]
MDDDTDDARGGQRPPHPLAGLGDLFQWVEVCTDLMAADGAAVVFGAPREPDTHHLLCATDTTAEKIADLFYVHGSGPHRDAMVTDAAHTVTVTDPRHQRRWPLLVTELDALGVGWVQAHPVGPSGSVVGTVQLYRRHVPSAVRGTDAGTQFVTALARALGTGEAAGDALTVPPDSVGDGATVNIAIGILAARHALTVGAASAMLVTGADDLDTLDGLVHRVLAAAREPVVIDDVTAFVSASIGVAVQPVDGTTVDDLLHNADVAMYSAKQNGRDRAVYFTAEMDHDADVRATIRHQLASAVRAHEFELHYQPIRSISTGATVMVEALMRWRRDGELVTASEFITLATETGQLRALGHLALDCLIDDVAALYRQFGVDHPRVAFNLSVTELRERELMDRLLSWHPDAGFDRIVIEVTEHVTLIPGDRAFGALTLLQRLGATISIDDFGTGYSNLELLGRLRPGIIKIDRTLTERAAEDVRGERILDAAVRLAHALEATAVIEGVGDARLSAVAAATGAELAQGYYHGHPMPLLDLIETIRDGG